MHIIFEQGKINDINELEQLYNEMNDYLEEGVNYPGWKKGVYPVRQNAVDGIEEGNLYIARDNGKIIGSVILSHEPEPAYYKVKWGLELDYSDVIVIRTFVVHPNYLGQGVGGAILNFCIEYGIKTHAKSIRLDVYEENTPAIGLYEKSGFKFIDNVDLGLGNYGLDWFKLYEKLL